MAGTSKRCNGDYVWHIEARVVTCKELRMKSAAKASKHATCVVPVHQPHDGDVTCVLPGEVHD